MRLTSDLLQWKRAGDGDAAGCGEWMKERFICVFAEVERTQRTAIHRDRNAVSLMLEPDLAGATVTEQN